ncbi:hypothetical protein DV735_g1867, partial [Chaetothyriales sp. CBS 134920]
MRIETCHLCSRPIYPSKGIMFVRNDAKVFRFCRSKCHKNFKMKRQPRKLKWTKTHRALRGKEMIVDQNLLLSSFQKRRNMPVKYDRDLVQATLKAMERIEEIRAKRERVFARRRLRGKERREKRRREDLKVVAEGEHLIRKELQDLEQARVDGRAEEDVLLEAQATRQLLAAPITITDGEEAMADQTWAAWILDSYAFSEADVCDCSETIDEEAVAVAFTIAYQPQTSSDSYTHHYQHRYRYPDHHHPRRTNHSCTVSAPSRIMSQQQQLSPFGPYARTGRGGAGNYHWHSDPVRRQGGGGGDDIEATAGLDLKQSSISERRQAAARLEQLQTAEALNGRLSAGPPTFGRGGAGNQTAARSAKQRLEDEQLQSEQASAERTREEVELHVLRTLQTPPGAILGHSQRSNRLLNLNAA